MTVYDTRKWSFFRERWGHIMTTAQGVAPCICKLQILKMDNLAESDITMKLWTGFILSEPMEVTELVNSHPYLPPSLVFCIAALQDWSPFPIDTDLDYSQPCKHNRVRKKITIAQNDVFGKVVTIGWTVSSQYEGGWMPQHKKGCNLLQVKNWIERKGSPKEIHSRGMRKP